MSLQGGQLPKTKQMGQEGGVCAKRDYNIDTVLPKPHFATDAGYMRNGLKVSPPIGMDMGRQHAQPIFLILEK